MHKNKVAPRKPTKKQKRSKDNSITDAKEQGEGQEKEIGKKKRGEKTLK